jgi:hypothetical protein
MADGLREALGTVKKENDRLRAENEGLRGATSPKEDRDP